MFNKKTTMHVRKRGIFPANEGHQRERKVGEVAPGGGRCRHMRGEAKPQEFTEMK